MPKSRYSRTGRGCPDGSAAPSAITATRVKAINDSTGRKDEEKENAPAKASCKRDNDLLHPANTIKALLAQSVDRCCGVTGARNVIVTVNRSPGNGFGTPRSFLETIFAPRTSGKTDLSVAALAVDAGNLDRLLIPKRQLKRRKRIRIVRREARKAGFNGRMGRGGEDA